MVFQKLPLFLYFAREKKYSLQVLVYDFEQILEALTFYNYKAQITSLTILLPDH